LKGLAGSAWSLWSLSYSLVITISIALLTGFFFDFFLLDFEVVVIRADFPEGCRETVCVADVA
jgi:hypothetical protein